MLFIWILGILATLVLLLCLVRVGVRFELHDGAVILDAKIGAFRLGVLPAPKQKPKRGRESTTKKTAGKGVEKPALPKLTLSDIKELVRVLVSPLKRALNRTWKGIRIHPLQVSVTLGGGEDPASAAELYGYLNAGMWTVMPEAERLINIPDPHIHIGVDFDAQETVIEASVEMTIRIGTLIAAAFTVGIPAIRWFLRYRKKQMAAEQPPKAART